MRGDAFGAQAPAAVGGAAPVEHLTTSIRPATIIFSSRHRFPAVSVLRFSASRSRSATSRRRAGCSSQEVRRGAQVPVLRKIPNVTAASFGAIMRCSILGLRPTCSR